MILDVVKIGLPAILIILGWWFVHHLTQKRDKNKELIQDARGKVDSVLNLAKELRILSADVFTLAPDETGEKGLKLTNLRFLVEMFSNEFTLLSTCHPVFEGATGKFTEFKQSITMNHQYSNANADALKLDHNIHYDILTKLHYLSNDLEEKYYENFVKNK